MELPVSRMMMVMMMASDGRAWTVDVASAEERRK